jgi:putative peptidoglycan lipid II flippase
MGGAFDYGKAMKSAEALFYYSFGLSFVALVRVLVPAFFALKDTRTPVITAFIAFLLNVGFSIALMGPLLHGGLALATTLSAICNLLLLLWFLRRKVGPFGGRRITLEAIKTIMASLPMALAVAWGVSLLDWSRPGEKFLKGGVLFAAIAGGVAVFLVCAHLLRCQETGRAMDIVRRKFRK